MTNVTTAWLCVHLHYGAPGQPSKTPLPLADKSNHLQSCFCHHKICSLLSIDRVRQMWRQDQVAARANIVTKMADDQDL
jgi:hypothetical protein